VILFPLASDATYQFPKEVILSNSYKVRQKENKKGRYREKERKWSRVDNNGKVVRFVKSNRKRNNN